ncbi:hypothetical protein SAMN05192533_101215 [Mesobacillus persicus]|uniref:Cell wall binding repeat 2 n=1 Tax=Mesobacillus persicus TaxID=930146 RepID=A0A1H7W0R7_9BACI|nr:cell wall-binding repeat-containing protein [Mesobacillus persicus]SEM15090.1 hypothetical protein SAMN05192533_101215 [Mesobacillus persicus]
MKKGWYILLIVLLSLGLAACNQDEEEKETADENKVEKTEESASKDENQADDEVYSTKNVTRLNVENIVDAAIMTSRTIWPATIEENKPKTVILVPTDNWQIALASADMIHHPTNGPVLFYDQDQISDETVKEIERLAPLGGSDGTEVMLMGEPNQKIVDQLKDYSVQQVKGSDPAEFAAKIDEVYAEAAGELPNSIIIVSAEEEAKLYSLIAANWISHMSEPILYITKDGIPEATREAINKRNNKANLYILGPEEAISSEIEDSLKEFGTVTRIEGNTAVETSIAFAKFKDEQTGFGWGVNEPGIGLVFTSTEKPEYAITAAPFAHLGKHAPLIWLENGELANETHVFLADRQPTFIDDPTVGPYNHAYIIGSGESITMETQGMIDQMLEIVSEGGGGHAGH